MNPNLIQNLTLLFAFFGSLSACSFSSELDRNVGSSDSQSYTKSQLRTDSSAKAGADKAIALLEDAGWCEIPKNNLPAGMSHSDLVRHMACIANKESTFGRYRVAGGGTTEYGHAYGFWQIVTGHMGRGLTVSGTRYSCPAYSISALRYDDAVSAKCALYVYMESIHLNGNSGLTPWEAVCSSSERELTRFDGSKVFRKACEDRACGTAPKIDFNTEIGEVHVQVDNKCDADSARFVFLKADGSTTSQTQTKGESKNITQKSALVDGKAVASYVEAMGFGFDLVRIIIEKNGREMFRTNPSPRLPASEPKITKQSGDISTSTDASAPQDTDPVVPVAHDHTACGQLGEDASALQKALDSVVCAE